MPLPPVVTACVLGLILSRTRVADVWAAPSVSVSLSGGTFTDVRDFASFEGVVTRHYTVTPNTPGGEVMVLSAGPLRVEAFGELTIGAIPETATSPEPYMQYRPVSVAWHDPSDINADGDGGTDLDIQDFFACIGGNCCSHCVADFDQDGDTGTDADIEAFFRTIAGHAKP